MRLLLGSGGARTPERIQTLSALMRASFGPIERLLFIPFALADHDWYVKVLIERGINAGYVLDGIHRHSDPVKAVRDAQGIFIGGGNTFRLLHSLYQLDLLGPIRERVLAGVPYLGVSAGTNVACPTIMTTNDMPIVQPRSFQALGLVPFQINPHYFSGETFVRRDETYCEHFGETRDDRLREFHEMNETPVLGIWEGGVLYLDGTELRLEAAPARIFRKGMPPVDVEPGTRLDELLRPA